MRAMTTGAMLVSHADRTAEIAALRSDGVPVRVIAEHLGLSRSRIYQIMAAPSISPEDQAACARFAMLPPDLAARVAQRFVDDEAVRAASDHELRSLRGMGSVQFAKLRARYPRSE